MKRVPIAFAAYGAAIVVLSVGVFCLARTTATHVQQDFSQRDQAVSIVAANIAQSIAMYDVIWDAPLQTNSVTLDQAGNEVVVEHVEAGGYVLTLQGTVTPHGILVGHLKELSSYKVSAS